MRQPRTREQLIPIKVEVMERCGYWPCGQDFLDASLVEDAFAYLDRIEQQERDIADRDATITALGKRIHAQAERITHDTETLANQAR